MTDLPLVHGRECGECKVCCSDLAIDTEEIQKTTRLACCNHKDGGCQIYDTRPGVCRSFYCGWRMLPQLGEEWRPSTMGVMIHFQKNNIPAGYTTRPGFQFLLLDPEAIRREEVVAVITSALSAEIPVFLALAGQQGTLFPNVFLNDFMRAAMASGDEGIIKAKLVIARDIMMAEAPRSYIFQSTLLPGAIKQQ